MRLKIVHLLADNAVSGVQTSLNYWTSVLSPTCEVVTVSPQNYLAHPERYRADVAIYHEACNWQSLPLLWQIRRHTKLWIHEHHYSAAFEAQAVARPQRFRVMLKLAYGLADRVIAVSEAQAAWITQAKLTTPDKLTTILQSVRLEDLLQVPPKPQGQSLILAAYGRFCPQKGFDVLIDAMRRLQDAPIELRLGGCGPDEVALRQRAEGLSKITWVGLVQDIPAFLSVCDGVIIPSRWEPWGNVCLEARAAGKPVIVSAVDGLPEQHGCLVPPGQVEPLTEAIRSWLGADLSLLSHHARRSTQDHEQRYLQQWNQLLATLGPRLMESRQ